MPTPIPADFPNKVSVSIGNDDSSCEKPSTARIREGGCSDGDMFGCTAYERVGGWSNVTYYGLGSCSHSREDYLKSAFKNSEIFMIEHYQDVKCSKLESTEVYRADGECHFFTLGVMKIWVAQDKSMAALLTSSHCENDNWNVALDLNVSVNTGACIPDNGSSNRAVKYVYIGGSDTLSTRAPSNYGRSLWPVRDGSLCVHEFVDPNVCRGFKAGLNLLEMSNQFFQYEQWMTSFLPHNDYYGKIPMLPDRFLQYLFPVNRWVFNLWKTACTQTYNPARPQELADCQCAHEQLIRGISAARRIQHITGRYDLDSEWCDLLRKRDQILYQGSGSSVLLDLCDRNIGEHLNDKRRALLDSILC
ncbi:hypothetical protein PHMEG_00014527 [Phytophthora megakarya]|uniref:Uncharacterized protein n=1 Tax=Phytophthora megakarya TaxID=4795 RepID=A0A225W638_9STRA|nr:hypothetical protein PHMEG_00014527 [Phytophthora megakarya]